VYKAPNSDCYIVFGEAKIEDMTSQSQLAAQQQYSGGAQNIENSGVAEEDDDDDDDIPELEAPDDDAALDETGVEAKDIELVMAQVNCSRAKAVRALKDSGGDLINASASSLPFSFLCPLTPVQSWPRASSSFFCVCDFEKQCTTSASATASARHNDCSAPSHPAQFPHP
jgi:NACalpha-BTF3-like transcription factor